MPFDFKQLLTEKPDPQLKRDHDEMTVGLPWPAHVREHHG
jgi:hypothetical protein